jgi:hypothetical protein
MTAFTHLEVGALESQEFQTSPSPTKIFGAVCVQRHHQYQRPAPRLSTSAERQLVISASVTIRLLVRQYRPRPARIVTKQLHRFFPDEI